MARIRANLAAIRAVRAIQAEDRPATVAEQAVLARWSGWGAAAGALDPHNDALAWVRAELDQYLDTDGRAAARRSTLNAHYTDASLVQAIWHGLTELGFTGGRVLEPGCGSGTFLGLAPDGAHLTGVELDPTTAAIAAALYPHARVVAESFAETRAAEGAFDATVGNVPFGDIRLHDRRHNPGNHPIHNHFVIKSLHLTRPGGLVAVITSAYTMDAANPAARREMQQLADLVGAVRLPSRAHARAAGTDALTDLLVLRRREPDRPPATFDWESTRPATIGGATVRVNGYFLDRPDRVLGELTTGDGLYRADELSVTGDPDAAPTRLTAALDAIAADARAAGLTMTPSDPTTSVSRQAALLPTRASRPTGYLDARADGTFTRQDDDTAEAYHPPQSQAPELRALLRLRDTAVALLEAEASTMDDTVEIDRLRAQLNLRYDAYLAANGPINRFNLRPQTRIDPATGRPEEILDPNTQLPKVRRSRPGQGGFRTDPFAPVVWALEIFDDETQTAAKADIFRQRVVAQRAPRLGADTAAEALAICIDQRGEVRLDTVAWLLGIDEADARAALGTEVFDDPETGRLEPAAAYLSGNVRAKLAAATAAGDDEPRYAVNVAALSEVLPRDLRPDEIAVQMGAPWIDATYVRKFLAEILDDSTLVVEHVGSMWTVASDRDHTVAATATWGTARVPASAIAQHVLEQRPIQVFDTIRTGAGDKRVPNLDATMAATDKAVEMRERFAEWVWEDPQRTHTLVRTYNNTFNSYVLRTYGDVTLSLPGMARSFTPRPHQVAAVARIIAEPAVGLYHTVGAGKTAVMIMAAMELRRLGLVRKPIVVTPNNILTQFAREWQHMYPRAKILVATKDDLTAERRRALVARMATGDWDGVVISESGFLRLPMSPKAETAYRDKQVADLDAAIDHARANGLKLSLKRLEGTKARTEQRIERKLDGAKDDGIWFELTGVDYIFRDESDRDKNLEAASNMRGVAVDGSQRASQMDMKLGYLRGRHPRWGTRATGTPVANSMVELYTEFRYLRPDLLQQLGIGDLDSYLATFAEPVTRFEVTPDGGGLRSKTRIAKFVNVPELLAHLHVFADVKTRDDLDLPRPQLAQRVDGERVPETVIVEPSAELLEKVAELVARAERIRGRRAERGDDNMLNITSEGRAAALDLRLVGLGTDQPSKLHVAADRIAQIWRETARLTYLDPAGRPHPTPGSLQLVFCDLGTPGDKKAWTVYDELRGLLVARGLPRDKVRFIHEAKDDLRKWELFTACRDGRVAVLIGSTERMGAGTNVQDRAVALHHLDCQWRPRDIEQREGRIDRQGNQNPEIQILRYVTERSFDAYMWQTVARKAHFIDQIMRPGFAGREAEDLGDGSLSYEEVTAAATGNPLLVDHAKAKAELSRLERLERGHFANLDRLRWAVGHSRREIAASEARIRDVDAALERRTDTRGRGLMTTLGDEQYAKRVDANHRIRAILAAEIASPANVNSPAHAIGELGGFAVTAKVDQHLGTRFVQLALEGCPGSEFNISGKELTDNIDIVTRLENRLGKLESLRTAAANDISRRSDEIVRAEHERGKPFRHTDALRDARDRFRELDTQVAALAAQSQAAEPAGTADPTPQASDRAQQGGAQSGTGASAAGWHAAPAGGSANDKQPEPDLGFRLVVLNSAGWPAAVIPRGGPGETRAEAAARYAEAQTWPQVRTGQWIPWLETPDTIAAAPFGYRVAALAEERGWPMSMADRDHLERAYAATVADPDIADDVWHLDLGDFSRTFDARFRANIVVVGRSRSEPESVSLLTYINGDRGPDLIAEARRTAYDQVPQGSGEANGEHLARNQSRAAAGTTPVPAVDVPVGAPTSEPVRVEVDGNSVLVRGTRRDDLTARTALKNAGFRWYPSLQAWGLPRSLRPDTRDRNVAQFVAAMQRAGRSVPVIALTAPDKRLVSASSVKIPYDMPTDSAEGDGIAERNLCDCQPGATTNPISLAVPAEREGAVRAFASPPRTAAASFSGCAPHVPPDQGFEAAAQLSALQTRREAPKPGF